MITKRVNRYYCEFCKKSGCSHPHIRRHEERCTMNPDRKCGMCAMFDEDQKPMSELLAILPDPSMFWVNNEYGRWFTINEIFYEAFEKLRDAVANCPACILATLRQKGIPVGAIDKFHFSDECKSWWSYFNDQHR